MWCEEAGGMGDRDVEMGTASEGRARALVRCVICVGLACPSFRVRV